MHFVLSLGSLSYTVHDQKSRIRLIVLKAIGVFKAVGDILHYTVHDQKSRIRLIVFKAIGVFKAVGDILHYIQLTRNHGQ